MIIVHVKLIIVQRKLLTSCKLKWNNKRNTACRTVFTGSLYVCTNSECLKHLKTNPCICLISRYGGYCYIKLNRHYYLALPRLFSAFSFEVFSVFISKENLANRIRRITAIRCKGADNRKRCDISTVFLLRLFEVLEGLRYVSQGSHDEFLKRGHFFSYILIVRPGERAL